MNCSVYKTTTLPVVWYDCETASFTLKEQHKLKVSEKVLEKKYFNKGWDGQVGILHNSLYIHHLRLLA
jgi:hypothetical protein